jgi:dethiobiotin synthetase
MAKGFFITGTDTGVGKTIMAGAIVKALMFLGLRPCAVKPIESGCSRDGDVLVPYDGMFLKQTAHVDEPLQLITPCCFESPLAPLAASDTEMTDVDLNEIRKSYAKLSRKYDAMVVEGIGGIMVPITKDYFVSNLASEFDLPLIIVARPGLGTINHTMLTVHCALREGLRVAGIIINYSRPPEHSLAEKTNAVVLAQICPVPIIGTFPYLKTVDEDEIARFAIKSLNFDILKKHL